ncbi:MAG: DUF2007 domain-containing protein [Candidatus Rokubacteria bacterium]|nr:DUF2007 domain-containing protein [Candidatus Rokubacteria bacterium]
MPRRAKVIRLPGRRGPPPAPPLDERALVEVHRCAQAEALVVKSLFESEGIPAVLRPRQVSSVYPFSVGDQGEVVILVPESEAARSRLLLARIASGPSFP